MNKTFTQFKSKLLAAVAMVMLSALPALAQFNMITGPTANGTSSLNRGPSGAADFQRTATIYKSTEFLGIAAGNVQSVGFSINAPAATAATGTIKIYMVNTTDATYNRGAVWSSIISTPTPMTLVYNGPLTIPTTTGFFSVTLQTPFAYTGGNFYMAYEWAATTKSATSATYDANADLPTSLVTIAATTLTGTDNLTGSSAFRPVLQLGFPLVANDSQVESVFTMGKSSRITGANTNQVQAVIKNGGTAMTNMVVTMTATGANPATQTVTIPSLAVGATTTVTFPYAPTIAGTNNISVSIPADANIANNTKTATSTVTANTVSYASTAVADNSVGFAPTTGNAAFLIRLNATGTSPVTVFSVRAYIGNDNNAVGKTVYGVVVDSLGNLIGRSADKVLAGGDLDSYVDFPITTTPTSGVAPTVTNTAYYVGLAQPTYTGTQYFPMGFQNELPQRRKAYYTWGLAATTPTKPTESLSGRRYLIEAVLRGTSLGMKEEMNAKLVSVYPNPSNGEFKVSATNMKGANLKLEIRDLQGKLIYSANAAKDGASINLNNVASGVYMLQVSTDSELAIKRLVIE